LGRTLLASENKRPRGARDISEQAWAKAHLAPDLQKMEQKGKAFCLEWDSNQGTAEIGQRNRPDGLLNDSCQYREHTGLELNLAGPWRHGREDELEHGLDGGGQTG
jgi:hypothetical protein